MNSTEAVPNWEVIGIALKSLLSRYDLDLNSIGQSQRLDYETFEKVFYHLFNMIDPPDCRRKFWSIYPARSREEQTKFIENSVDFINSRKLSSLKVSASQLRMFGGEPFRRLLTYLIMKSADIEIANINSKSKPSPNQPEATIDECLDSVEELQRIILDRIADLSNEVKQFNSLQDTLANRRKEINEIWGILNPGKTYDKDQIKSAFKSLLARLEDSNGRCSVAANVVKQIPTPMDIPLERTPISKRAPPDRMSCLVREMRGYLGTSPVQASDDSICQKLIQYDEGVHDLISKWEEAYLATPEGQRKYKFFEKIIPLINIEPIDCTPISDHKP